MTCSNCKAENPSGSIFCSNCGDKIIADTNSIGALKSQSQYFLWYICWEYSCYIFWYFTQNYLREKLFSSNGSTDWDSYGDFTNYALWVTNIGSVMFLAIIAFLIPNKNYRAIIILLALVRIGLIIGNRLV
jgi:hypothetical protein